MIMGCLALQWCTKVKSLGFVKKLACKLRLQNWETILKKLIQIDLKKYSVNKFGAHSILQIQSQEQILDSTNKEFEYINAELLQNNLLPRLLFKLISS